MKAYRIIVAGMVQGVGYRYFARTMGNRMGISGWVRNCPDGRVEVHCEGDESSLDQMIMALKQGPSGAVVETMTVQETEPTYIFGFDIRF